MDDEILTLLRGDKTARIKGIRSLMQLNEFRNHLNAYIMNNSGNKDDATMILSDTLIAFSKKVFKEKEFKPNNGIVAYLIGIAKFKWLDELKKRKQRIPTTELTHTNIPNEEYGNLNLLIRGEKANLLKSILSLMKVNCKEVIMYWAGKYKMSEIAKMLGYKSEGVARKKKSECMKELLIYLSEHPKVKAQLRS